MELEQWAEKFVGDSDVKGVDPYPTFLNNGTVFKKAVRITMADGSVVAGCTWPDCTEVAKHPTTITTSHWRTHTGEKVGPRGPYRKDGEYSHLSFRELVDALREADDKVRRAEAARDRYQELNHGLRASLHEARQELERVKNAVRVLYPGALG